MKESFILTLSFLTCFLLKPTEESSIRFQDVTQESGIRFRHHGGSPQKKILVEEMSGGVALFDYNADGLLDIYLTTGPSLDPEASVCNRLYRNLGDWRFEDVTESSGTGFSGWSMGASAADYNGDGLIDLYITNVGANALFRNNGDGSFTDVASSAGVDCPLFSTGSAFADYDLDGDLDLFVANYVEYDLDRPPMSDVLCQYRGIAVACGPRGMQGAPDRLYRNQGNGTFTDVSEEAGVSDGPGYYGLGVVWSDFDNDSDPDLFVANDSTPNYLYLNEGGTRFRETALMAGVAMGENAESQACMGVEAADFDNNGWMDVFVTNFSEEPNTLYRALLKGQFEDATHEKALAFPSLLFLSWGTGALDVELDGDLDLFVANGHIYPQVDQHQLDIHYEQPNHLFVNKGEFFELLEAEGSGLSAIASSRGAAFGDLDSDGDIDIVVNNMDAAPTVLRNESKRSGNWIGLELQYKSPNVFAIGARVLIHGKAASQSREVRSGGSYLSQNDLRIHVGMSKKSLEGIEIRWPRGEITRLNDIRLNQYTKIRYREP